MIFVKIFKSYGGVLRRKFRQKFFLPYFVPYIKMDKNSSLEYHIIKFLTHPSESQYWFKIVTLSPP